MNIFERARKQEEQAEEIYRKLGETAVTIKMKAIFTRLGEAEIRHREIIKQMEKGEKVTIDDPEFLIFSQQAISKMKSEKEKFKAATSQTEAYKAAQAQEADAENLYWEHAGIISDEHRRNIFLALANEEHQHYTVLDIIIEFIIFLHPILKMPSSMPQRKNDLQNHSRRNHSLFWRNATGPFFA